MSSELGAVTILKILDDLKGTVCELAARAERLNQEHRVKTGREHHVRDAALAREDEALSAAVNEAAAAFLAAKGAAEARNEKRKAIIGDAYQSSRKQALEDVEKQTGQRKYELQKRMLQAERDRETGQANAATTLVEFKANLDAEQQSLATLEIQAQKLFRGYGGLVRALRAASQNAATAISPDDNELLSDLRELAEKTRGELRRFGEFLPLRIFKFLPVWALLALGEIPLILNKYGHSSDSWWKAGGAVAASIVLVVLVRFAAKRKARPLATSIADTLSRARHVHDAAFTQCDVHYQQELQRLADDYQNTTQTLDQELKRAVARAGEERVTCRMESDGRAFRILARNDQQHRRRLAEIERQHADAVEQLRAASGVRSKTALNASQAREAEFTATYDAEWRALVAEWQSRTKPAYQSVAAVNSITEKLFPPWKDSVWANWKPPLEFEHAAKFGRLEVDMDKLCGGLPQDGRLVLPGPSHLGVTLSLAYPDQGSIIFETANSGHDEAIRGLNGLMLRLLSVSPPGRLNFTIIDPVGLGQNFAGIMHLADYEEHIINSRIWTQPGQIEQRLLDLNEHMEKVIQMYLRNEYKTIAEYNEHAGVIAEKYYFLVVADFPAGFNEAAAKRLLSIAASGAKCGVYLLLHWDLRQPLPQDFIPDELRRSGLRVGVKAAGLTLPDRPLAGTELMLDEPPAPDFAIDFIHRVGKASRDSGRVEVPFAQIAPAETEVWTGDTSRELRVPIGRTGATKFQYLEIGKGTCQHALIAGKTGSGKSTLFHVMITNLALWCSPEQVEFYLVDFKKGVEFKCYASHKLPHARVVAIESDREFGLSVLQRLDAELKRRGDLYRSLGVQDLSGYKRAGGTEPMPRSLLMIDEFQEFFVEDDTISQTASMLLDRIVRQGRAFGIHVLLGSQTLGGAYTVARTTLGQMVIRIALQCNEADAYLIMDENNPAPRLLSRPGEGIYNDMAGAIQGNSPFQVVWLPDEVRDTYLSKVRERADQNGKVYPGPIVFEGNAPSDVRDNPVLAELLESSAVKPPAAGRIWMGAPNSIKGPTEVVFQRQAGNSLILVGQRDEAILAILSVALVSLAAQYPVGAARFVLCDPSPPGSPSREFLDRIVRAIPHRITAARPGDLPEVFKGLADEMKLRADAPDAETGPPAFLFIHGLQRYSKLRYEEDFSFSASDPDAPPNPALLLNDLICEGARLGFHVIAACDSYNNVMRFMSRKALSEIELRVLFQMSANDSASLIDNPKAGNLGLHRALFCNEQESHLETFRPYAIPGNDWIEGVARNLKRLLQTEAESPA